MCSRCLSNSNSNACVLKRSIVLLWWFWISFPFVFIKADSHHATYIIVYFCSIMLKLKKWLFITLSAFSLSPHVQVLQTLAWLFMMFIHWALDKFSFELNRKLVQSSVCIDFISKKVTILRGLSLTIWLTATRLCKAHWQTGDANTRLRFSGEARFLIFTQKWLSENIGYHVSFKRKSLLMWNDFRHNITLSNHWPPTSEFF